MLSDEGPMLETLDYTIRIGSIPTFLYFDLYLYSAYAAHFVCIHVCSLTHFQSLSHSFALTKFICALRKFICALRKLICVLKYIYEHWDIYLCTGIYICALEYTVYSFTICIWVTI